MCGWTSRNARLKKAALLEHPSQLGADVVDFAEGFARMAAQGQDFEYAESFRRFILEEDPIHE